MIPKEIKEISIDFNEGLVQVNIVQIDGVIIGNTLTPDKNYFIRFFTNNGKNILLSNPDLTKYPLVWE